MPPNLAVLSYERAKYDDVDRPRMQMQEINHSQLCRHRAVAPGFLLLSISFLDSAVLGHWAGNNYSIGNWRLIDWHAWVFGGSNWNHWNKILLCYRSCIGFLSMRLADMSVERGQGGKERK